MTDTGLPTYLSRGLSLSHAELCTELGKELLSLCHSVTSDGRLAPEELEGLKQWLSDAEAAAHAARAEKRQRIFRRLGPGRSVVLIIVLLVALAAVAAWPRG